MSTVKTIVGIRPTGKLHIGHYFSVIKPALEEKADVLIASYHVPKPTKGIYPIPFEMSKALQRYGVKTKFQTIDEDLYFSLLSASRMAELRRLTQYKSAALKTPHLLLYP